MSNGEQASAIRLLLAAAELLHDGNATPVERERIAVQIDRFVNHQPVDDAVVVVTPRRPHWVQR
jgi:hypothetical protein